jgi:predicted SAM-dependent methyltransferase
LCLNLGCGEYDIRQSNDEERWVNIDKRPIPGVVQGDVRKLKFPDVSVDEIAAKDILEHIPWTETEQALGEWSRVLKPGGKIYVQCPDIGAICQKYVEQSEDWVKFNDWPNWKKFSFWMFGRHDNWGGEHHAGFDIPGLKMLLEQAGFVVESIGNDGGTNIQCWAVKREV